MREDRNDQDRTSGLSKLNSISLIHPQSSNEQHSHHSHLTRILAAYYLKPDIRSALAHWIRSLPDCLCQYVDVFINLD